MVAQGERLQDICRHDRVSFDTDKYVPPCFCVLQSSMLCSDSDTFPAAPHSFSSLIQSLPSCWGWVCRAPKLWGLRILEIVMENKGGVTIPRWAFGLAAAVVALLVVLVIVLIPRGGDNSNTSASGGSNGAAQSNSAAGNSNGAAQSKSTSTVEAGTCGAGASDDQAVLDAAPKNTKWVTTDSGWIGPVSKTAGPMVDSPIRSCFEHSAEGALYAASWIMLQVNDPATSQQTYERYVINGPKWEEPSGGLFRIAGYQIISADADRVTIRLAVTIPSVGDGSAWWSSDLTMVWQDGEWRLRVPDTASTNPLGIARVSDTSKFIRWSA